MKPRNESFYIKEEYISNRKFKRITKKKSNKEIEMKHIQSSLAELVIIKQINEN
jgi:hypothetical protein